MSPTKVAVVLVCGLLMAAAEAQQVPAIYVFGDSTVDVGNNQYLPGNPNKLQLPYGIDFPHSTPTGRFSNGYNAADFIAKLLGFKRSPPAYLSLTPKTSRQIMKGLRGANYASGGSGILDTTGNALTLTKQIEYFAATKSKMSSNLDSKTVDELLSKSLFLISDGGNDMFAFLRQNKTASQVPSFYADLLSNYTSHITALYKMGARKFGIIDVAPIGCVPAVRVSNPEGGGAKCVERANRLAKGFNDELKILMAKLTAKLPGIKYSIGSSYNTVSYMIAHPRAAGFKDVDSACCGGGCLPNSTYCANRREFLFWDAVHGTQATSNKAAAAVYAGPLHSATPINFKQLSRL